jgi:hypothetical protein
MEIPCGKTDRWLFRCSHEDYHRSGSKAIFWHSAIGCQQTVTELEAFESPDNLHCIKIFLENYSIFFNTKKIFF